ncbi:hypothetical protein A2154_03790 [Candidatus Gottesmanbacteria bacterium RBG_16_43_7]|uniref:Uncharacterized protein n=1 Tax=Candidatus Gottesmanbacteria bacterium RBG_16_43_7 TaxID=1798373 RepID=A0A1F5Z8R9_9BACT|nr:MAG: hypothetical protein A2154_03790 [Candidatus Gottesmanbacteria bacterium RBG_16_43_7]
MNTPSIESLPQTAQHVESGGEATPEIFQLIADVIARYVQNREEVIYQPDKGVEAETATEPVK